VLIVKNILRLRHESKKDILGNKTRLIFSLSHVPFLFLVSFSFFSGERQSKKRKGKLARELETKQRKGKIFAFSRDSRTLNLRTTTCVALCLPYGISNFRESLLESWAFCLKILCSVTRTILETRTVRKPSVLRTILVGPRNRQKNQCLS